MKKLLLVFLLLPQLAYAQASGQHVYQDIGTLINGIACNASASARRFTLSSAAGYGYGLINLQVNFTRSAATAVAMTCDTSITSRSSWAVLQSCAVASGVCTSSDASWSKAVSASGNWNWRVDFLGAPDARCTFSCTGGGAGDTFIVYGSLVTL